MRVGDKYICKQDNRGYTGECFQTKGKIYHVVYINSEFGAIYQIGITCDADGSIIYKYTKNGNFIHLGAGFFTDYFESIKTNRKRKLKQINGSRE